MVQTADNTVRVYGLDGGSMVLTKAPAKLDPLNFTVATNAISDTIYASSAIGNPSPVVSVDSAGVHAVAALKTPLTGEVVGGGKMAWGALVVTGTVTTAQLFVGAPDGSQAKSIVKSTSNTSQVPKVWRPVQFSKDGSRLYYGLEPSGLGGYILFGGASNLTSYSLSDGKSTELIKDKQLGSLCIDSVSPNDKLVVYHCGDKQLGVYDLTTKKASVIQLPADAGEAKSLGDARFNPDSTRVTFAAARHNPDDEQGWILVSTGLTGASKVVAKSAAKDYYELITWLNADTLLLQSHNPQTAVWTVKADGTGLQKLSDGQFLSILPAQP